MKPRIYALEGNKICTVADKLQSLVALSFRRTDLNGEGVFRVKDARMLLDESFLPKDSTATRWVKSIPIKINVFAWKVYLDRLPTRLNLMKRGVLVPSLLCPVCNADHEDTSHLLFSCSLANEAVRLNVESFKELWDSLEAKYMAEDASSKKFLKDFKHTLKHLKDELTLVKLGSHLRNEESLRVQDNDKPKRNNIAGPLVVNMVKHNNSSRYNDNKGKRKHHDYTRADPNKKAKLTCWKCGKISHIKRDYKGVNVGNKANGSGIKGSVDGSSNSLKGATVYVCIDRCWFKTYESLNDRSILHMGNESTTLVHRRGCVDLRLHIVNDNIGSAFMSTSKLNDLILWHARLGHVHFKRMQDMSKDGLIPAFDIDTKKFLELIHSDLCDLHATPSLGNKKYFVTFIDDASRFCYVYLLDTKDEALDKFKVFKTEVELQQGSLMRRFRTDKGGLSQGFWGFGVVGQLFYVIEPNESVSINSIIESRDAIFDKNRLSSVPRPSLRIPNSTEDIGGSMVPEEVTEEEQGMRMLLSRKKQLMMRWTQLWATKLGCWLIYLQFANLLVANGSSKRKLKVDGTIEKFKARLVIQCFKQKSGIDYFDTYALVGLIRSIMYAVRCTRPNVAFAQNLTSRFQQNPGEPHWTAMKNILKYLRNTKDMFLVYGGNPSTELRVECYCDAGFETDRDDTKSQTGYVFVLNGGAVDWKSSKQSTTAMSATESEYIAASEAAMEAVWIRKFISGLGIVPTINEPLNMYCDNSAAVHYANEPGVQKGARHYQRRYHYVRECVELGEIRILKVHTDNNLADPFTKALSNRKLTQHARGMGLRPASSFM
ncbi:zinc finger, CCHC-type containing protein [Tanacetum coccineum]